MSTADRILNESGLWLADVPQTLPPLPGGKRISADTLLRWRTRGVTLPDGRRVVLETVRVGGRNLTSREALARFVAAQQTTEGDESASVESVRSPDKRNKASEAAERELIKAGC